MSYSKLCAIGFGCYEHVRFVNEMNNSRSRYLSHLDAMNRLGLWMTWTILYHKLNAQNAMNNSGLRMTRTTMTHELWALDAMNSIGLYMLWIAQDYRCYEQLKVVDEMNKSRSWAQASKWYDHFKVVVDLNDSRWWAERSRCYEWLKVLVGINDLSRELKTLDAINNLG